MLVLPDSLLQSFLHEDVPYGDLTTGLLAIGAKQHRLCRAHTVVALRPCPPFADVNGFFNSGH